jgi:iron complex transport system substrate-binding protein
MRIVSLLPSATDIIAEIGLLDSLVGVSDDCNWPPEIQAKPLVARTRVDLSDLSAAQIDELIDATASESHSLYAVDAELMAELAPDVVITQDVCEVCAVSSGDLASACPVGAELFSINARTLGDVLASVVDLAERLGVHERGLAVAGKMREEIEAVRTATVGAERPRVFVAEWIDPPYGAGHWVPEMVEAAGGSSVLGSAGEYSVRTSWEAVLDADPKLVVVAACGFDVERTMARAGGLRLPVPTVVVDGDAYFSRPAPGLADGVRQLGHLLHPERVDDPGLPCQWLPMGAFAPVEA